MGTTAAAAHWNSAKINKLKKKKVACNQAELRVITFFEQAGVDKEDEKAADRRSGQCPRNSGQLHPGAGRLVADRDSRAAGETHSTSAHRHALAHTLPAKFSIHSLRAKAEEEKKKIQKKRKILP